MKKLISNTASFVIIVCFLCLSVSCAIPAGDGDTPDDNSKTESDANNETNENSESNETNENSETAATDTIPDSADVSFTIDASAAGTPISPYIYGSNFSSLDFTTVPFRIVRSGGNRWSAYNWENNASNAGNDWYFHNDSLLGSSDVPGYGVTNRISQLFDNGCAALITIPILEYVAKDKDGTDVRKTPNYLTKRFLQNKAFKGSALSSTPDINDNCVYQDEFVYFLKNEFPNPQYPILYSLDNEPDLWNSTHEAIHPDHPTYDEVVNKNIEYARAIKSIDEDAVTLGFVSYGFAGFLSLQDDATVNDYETNGDFVSYYLSKAAEAETTYGKRLIDVLDIHWYPEAKDSNDTRITTDSYTQEMPNARMQAPRTLWDSSYTENSWIGKWCSNYLPLLPWLQEEIDTHYPGTKLAISEYYYGGGDRISGAIAEADVLGIFGREGLYEASIWVTSSKDQSFIEAAFNMYLNYDGRGSSFGDTTVSAKTTDDEKTSVYASRFSDDSNKMVLVAINKSSEAVDVGITLTASGNNFATARFYCLTSSSDNQVVTTQPDDRSIGGNQFYYRMPGYSVTTIELTR